MIFLETDFEKFKVWSDRDAEKEELTVNARIICPKSTIPFNKGG